MGLSAWKHGPQGKILKSDMTVAKNYLSEAHVKQLNRIVSAYLDLARGHGSSRRTESVSRPTHCVKTAGSRAQSVRASSTEPAVDAQRIQRSSSGRSLQKVTRLPSAVVMARHGLVEVTITIMTRGVNTLMRLAAEPRSSTRGRHVP
jgi:hypothetical protein